MKQYDASPSPPLNVKQDRTKLTRSRNSAWCFQGEIRESFAKFFFS